MLFDQINISALEPGTYRITARFDGNDQYNPRTVVFELIIGEDPNDTHVVIDLDDQNDDMQPADLSWAIDIDENTGTYQPVSIVQVDDNKYKLATLNNPHTLDVTITCNTDNYNIIDNEYIILPDLGEYIITATFAGSQWYYPDVVQYVLRITDDEGHIVFTKRNYQMYLEKSWTNNERFELWERDDHMYTLQYPKTQRTSDNVCPDEIIECCYFTIGDSPTIHRLSDPIEIDEIGSYDIHFVFEGNDEWLPWTGGYTLVIKEKLDAGISFEDPQVYIRVKEQGKYVLPKLINNYNLSPIYWYCHASQEQDIVIQPEYNVMYIKNRTGAYPIYAEFKGDETHKAKEVVCIVNLIGTQEDAQIYYSPDTYRYDYEWPIDGGATVTLPKLVNDYNLPYTLTVSDPLSATVEVVDNSIYDSITFFKTTRDLVVTAHFAGNEWFDEMEATCTLTFIAWADRPQPTLSFTKSIADPDIQQANSDNTYTLLVPYIYPEELRSRLVWSCSNETHSSFNEEHTQITIDEFDFYDITVSFPDGDEDWAPVSATYRLQIRRGNVVFWFVDEEDNAVTSDTVYGIQAGYLKPHKILRMRFDPVEVPVTFSTSPYMQIDEDNREVWIRKPGQYAIIATFEGDAQYEWYSNRYVLFAEEEDDPSIEKIQPTIWFDPNAVAIPFDSETNSYDLSQYVHSSDAVNIHYRFLNDNNTIPSSAIVGSNLFTMNAGEWTIEAYSNKDDYYHAAVSTNQLHIVLYVEEYEKQEIELRCFTTGIGYDNPAEDNTYDWEPRVGWRLVGQTDDDWQVCDFDLTWSCIDLEGNTINATFTYSEDFTPQPIVVMEVGSGIYRIRASFAGNDLYYPAYAEYELNIGRVEIEPVSPNLAFSDEPSRWDEDYENKLYDLKTVIKPDDINNADLHWSISPSGQNWIELRGDKIYVADISQEITITVNYAGNVKYLPEEISYTMTITPEQITKKDTFIRFDSPSITLDYDDFGNVWIEPQHMMLYEYNDNGYSSMSFDYVDWGISGVGGMLNGEFIEENGVRVGVQNPKFRMPNAGTYTISAQYMGDRYHNPSPIATYTITLEYTFADVHFESPIQYHMLDTSSGHFYYPIQEVKKPDYIQVTYYLYWGENDMDEINQEEGCDLIGSTGDYEIRAYWTEHGIENFTSYTLVVTESMIEYDSGTVAFESSEIERDYSSTGRYQLQTPTCTGVYVLRYTTIHSGNYHQSYNGYITSADLEEGMTYNITLTYRVGGDDNDHDISYTLYIRPEYYGITFNPTITYSKIYLNMSKSISSRYTISVSMDAENVCEYGNGSAPREYGNYYFTKSINSITIDSSYPFIDFPIAQYGTSNFGATTTYPYWYRFTKATFYIAISNNIGQVLDRFVYIVERERPSNVNYYYDTIVWKPITWSNSSYPKILPSLSIDTNKITNGSGEQVSYLYCKWNDDIGTNSQSVEYNGPITLTPCDIVTIAEGTRLVFEAPNNTTANVTMYKPNNETYMAHTSETHTENITMNLVGQFEPVYDYVGLRWTRVRGNPVAVNVYCIDQLEYYTSVPNDQSTPILMIENPDYDPQLNTIGHDGINWRYMLTVNMDTYIYLRNVSSAIWLDTNAVTSDGLGSSISLQWVGNATMKNRLHFK